MGSNPNKPSKRQSDPEAHVDSVLAAVKELWMKHPQKDLLALLKDAEAYGLTVSGYTNIFWHRPDSSLVDLLKSAEASEVIKELESKLPSSEPEKEYCCDRLNGHKECEFITDTYPEFKEKK